MNQTPTSQQTLFEATSVLGKRVRSHKTYWQKIRQLKHPEFKFGISEIRLTLTNADAVYQSRHSENAFLYTKRFGKYNIVVVVRHLNSDGFLITSYQTTKSIKTRKQVWPK